MMVVVVWVAVMLVALDLAVNHLLLPADWVAVLATAEVHTMSDCYS